MTYVLGLHHRGGFRISMGFTKTLSGKIYPNGQFGIGIIRRFKSEYVPPTPPGKIKTWQENCIEVHGVLETLRFVESRVSVGGEVSMVPNTAEVAVPLDSSLGSNSHKGKRGLNGITGHGKNLVRNAALLLEQRYGVKRLTFLTLTLPEMGKEAWKDVGRDWARVVKVLTQWISRRLQSVGLPGHVVSVTEVQGRRFTTHGVPGYHLHAVFVGKPKIGAWAITPSEMRAAWKRAVAGSVGDIAETVSWASCENMQAVRSSASGYLGKYMSKGSEQVGQVAAIHGDDALPSTWYNCTAVLRLAVRRSCQRLSDEECRDVLRIADSTADSGGLLRHICLSHDGGETVVGWYGRVSTRDMLASGYGRKNLDRALATL